MLYQEHTGWHYFQWLSLWSLKFLIEDSISSFHFSPCYYLIAVTNHCHRSRSLFSLCNFFFLFFPYQFKQSTRSNPFFHLPSTRVPDNCFPPVLSSGRIRPASAGHNFRCDSRISHFHSQLLDAQGSLGLHVVQMQSNYQRVYWKFTQNLMWPPLV